MTAGIIPRDDTMRKNRKTNWDTAQVEKKLKSMQAPPEKRKRSNNYGEFWVLKPISRARDAMTRLEFRI